jgi:RNA polymerase sigma factor (sigma-70 family)
LCGLSACGYYKGEDSMTEDAELLRRYAQEGSEEAFTELVRRHINLVYAGALRRVHGDAHLAEDVTQNVFTALARTAPKLVRHPVLAGWLHKTTRFAAAQTVRTERRRLTREQEANIMNEATMPDTRGRADWMRLRPLIDEVLDELDASDRDAVLLRFFEGRSFAEVGERLHLAENTARMRVDRALDKMNALLARRGVTSTVAALGLALTSQVGVTAPAGLAATVSATAIAATVTGLSLLTLMSTAKFTIGAIGLVSALAVGTMYYQATENRVALAVAHKERDAALARLRSSESALLTANDRADAADKDNAALLAVIDKTTAKNKETNSHRVTADEVLARFQRAQELARSGKREEALSEFLWCYDEGMVRVRSFGGVRSSFLLHELAKLAKTYPPALAALHERRDAVGQLLLNSVTDSEAALDYVSLNRELGEQDLNLSLFEKLPASDPLRGTLLSVGGVFDQLVAARRYGEIASVRSYEEMTRSLEINKMTLPVPDGSPAKLVETIRALGRKRAIASAATDIEVLAGSLQFDRARELAGFLFAYDLSPETRRIVQEHLNRAGHPGLLDTP